MFEVDLHAVFVMNVKLMATIYTDGGKYSSLHKLFSRLPTDLSLLRHAGLLAFMTLFTKNLHSYSSNTRTGRFCLYGCHFLREERRSHLGK